MTPLRVIMLSYERKFLDPRSEHSPYAAKDVKVTAIVLSRAEKAFREDRGDFCVIGLTGSAPVRFFGAVQAAIQEVKRARKAGERVMISAQDPFIAGKIAFLVSRLMDVPYEVQEHGDFFSGAWERELPVIHECMAGVGKFILRRADGVRTVSERVRDRLVRLGVVAERIMVIPVAQQLAPLFLCTPSHPSDVPTIVVPCRFVKQKGLDVLLEACAQLMKQGIPFRLRLIGEGILGPELADKAYKLGIREQVEFEGWSTPEHIWKDADLFVLSSRYEGWGRTVVEAMAAGVPIVATDVGCVGFFLRPQIDGRVVQPGDVDGLASAIKEQLSEQDRRDWMVANAREHAKDFPLSDDLIEKQQSAWRSITSSPEAVAKGGKRRAWKITAGIIAFSMLIHGLSVALFGHSLGANREWGFFTQVQHWFQGYGYSYAGEAGCVSAYRSPGFLFFLTGVYGLFGFPNFFAQAVVQNVLAVVLTYLVYRLGYRISNDRRVGWIAALLVTLHPYTFYNYTRYYHTILSAFFLIALMLAVLGLERTRKMRWAWLSGAMIACLAYVQGTILAATPFLSLWLLWRWRKEWKRAIVAIAIMGIASAALIAPWTYRNWNAFHRLIPLTTDVGLPFYKSNTENYEALLLRGYPHEVLNVEQKPGDPSYVRYTYLPEIQAVLQQAGGMKESAFWTQWHPSEPIVSDTCNGLPSVSEPDMDTHWKALAWNWYRQNLWPDALRLSAEKAVVFWAPVLYPSVRYGAPWSFGNQGTLATLAYASFTGYVALIELLAIVGIVVSIRRKRVGLIVPLLIVCVIYTLLHAVMAPYTKYRIPLDNLVAVLAAIGAVPLFARLWRMFRKQT